MSLHDDMSRLLEAEVSEVQPSPELWERVRAGVAQRGRRSWWVRGGIGFAATATAALVALVVTQLPADKVAQEPPATQPPSEQPTSRPTPTIPDDGSGYLGTIWPFTTRAAIAAYRGTAYDDPARTALAFTRTYLGLTDVSTGTATSADGTVSVPILAGGREVGTVTLTARFSPTPGAAPYVVTSVVPRGEEFVLHAAEDWSQPARDPYFVTGRVAEITAVLVGGRQLMVSVLDDAGRSRGTTAADTFGPEGEWSVRVDLPAKTSIGGAAVAVVTGPEAEALSVAAQPVRLLADQPTYPTAAPSTYVAVFEGAVMVVTTRTGAVLRTLSPGYEHLEISSLSVTDDGRFAYYAIGSDGRCDSTIYRVPTDGSAPPARLVGTGVTSDYNYLDPAPSPDGRRLAYVRSSCGATGEVGSELVSRTLATGAETRWPAAQASPEGSDHLLRPAWSPNGDRIAVLYNSCCGDFSPEPYVVDSSAPGPVLSGRRVGAGFGYHLASTEQELLLAAGQLEGFGWRDLKTTGARDFATEAVPDPPDSFTVSGQFALLTFREEGAVVLVDLGGGELVYLPGSFSLAAW